VRREVRTQINVGGKPKWNFKNGKIIRKDKARDKSHARAAHGGEWGDQPSPKWRQSDTEKALFLERKGEKKKKENNNKKTKCRMRHV